MAATPSVADDDLDGRPCETSRECGASLKCIDERCRDVAAILRGEDVSVWTGTVGHVAMFGNGEGYGTAIAAIDIAATVTEPFLVLAATTSQGATSSVFGVISFVPTGFAGPIVHIVHGRYIPAVISFFAWTSLAGSTFVVGGLFGLAGQNGFEFNTAAAWAGGLVFGAGGAALVTWLDVWMAREVAVPEKRSSTSLRIMPGLMPTRGGAMASLAGSF